MKNKNRQVEKDASLAISGAEYVKEKLLALAGLGPTSLYDQVYAIKARIKGIDSLVEKVLEKRKYKQYDATKATDIVGIRLLCLYARDLPLIAKSLVAFIRFCQNQDIKLMRGTTIDDCILEVIVYKSTINARIYDTIHKYFLELGLSDANINGEKKVKIINYTGEDKTYSSVHIVVYCTSYAGGVPKTIPVEFQLRTIFEDAWGEIDHSLEYKLAKKVKRKIPQELVASHSVYKSILYQLKDLLDQAGQFAENVRTGYEQIYDAASTRQKTSEFKYIIEDIYNSDDFENAANLRTGNSMIDGVIFDKVIPLAEKCRKLLLEPINNQKEFGKIDLILDEYINVLRNELHDTKKYDELQNLDTLYFLYMELGHSLLSKYKIRSYFAKENVSENIKILVAARENYFLLEKYAEYKEDSMLNFRLGMTFVELNEKDLADYFLIRSCDSLLDTNQKISNKLYYAIIPNYYSYVVWSRRAKLLELGYRSNNPMINRDDQYRMVCSCLNFALVADYNLSKFGRFNDTWTDKIRLRVYNNIICYLWEIGDLSYSNSYFKDTIDEILEDLRNFGITLPDFDIARYYDFIVANCGPIENNIAIYDTLTKYYHLVGDVKNLDLHRLSLRDMLSKLSDSLQKGDFHDLLEYSISRTESRDGAFGLFAVAATVVSSA